MRVYRKGSYDYSRKALYFIIVIFVLAFIFLYMHAAILEYASIKAGSRDAIAANIILQEILMSPRCFAYYDEAAGKACPGILDSEKLKGGIKTGCLDFVRAPFHINFYDRAEMNQAGLSPVSVIARDWIGETKETVTRPILIRQPDGTVKGGALIAEFGNYFIKDGQVKNTDGYDIREKGEIFLENMK